MRRSAAIALLGALMAPGLAAGADADGRFAIKGAGVTTCERFVKEREAGSTAYLQYAGWVMGYVSAVNTLEEDTFDIAPWEGTDLLLAILAANCAEHPEAPFAAAVQGMVESLHRDRLQETSQPVRFKVGEREFALYETIVRRMQERLKGLGHYASTVDGDYGPGTQAAVKAFQESIGLEATGMPDPVTMTKLLRP
jgi:hypothetical protein